MGLFLIICFFVREIFCAIYMRRSYVIAQILFLFVVRIACFSIRHSFISYIIRREREK